MTWRRSEPHFHNESPAPNDSPFFTEILWHCSTCLQPHVFDLLKNAARVASEVSLYGRAIRPDITLFDDKDTPVAFFEFKKTNLSKKVELIAKEKGIPLFVIDVTEDGAERRMLHNPQDRWWKHAPEVTEETSSFLEASGSLKLRVPCQVQAWNDSSMRTAN